MKSVEEFQNTQKLIDEYNGFDSKVSELESKIEQNEKVSNLRIKRLNEQLNITWEDAEFEIDRESLQKQIEKSIKNEEKNLSKENADLNKEIKDAKDSKKFFRTDNHFKIITMEIEAMKREVADEELELKKKNIELQEFYKEESHENKFGWKEIYDQIDSIKDNIQKLNAKIQQYTEFKEELNSINLTPDEYKEMFKREAERVAMEEQSLQPEQIEPDPVQTQPTKPDPTQAQPTKPDPTQAQLTKPDPAQTQPTKPDPTQVQSIKPDTAQTQPTKPDPTQAQSTKPQPKTTQSKQDYLKFIIDSDSNQAIVEEMQNGMHSSVGFNLDKIFQDKRSLRKEAKEFIKENDLEDYSKIIKMVNPAVLKLLLAQNDKKLMKDFLDVYCGEKDKLPIEYNVKFESNSIYMNEKTFRQLNRSLIKDNKYLGTDFTTTPFYTLKKILSRFPGLGDKYKNALPVPQGNELQNAIRKKEKFELQNTKTHENFVEQYKINESEYNKNKDKAQKLKAKMKTIIIKNNPKGLGKVKNSINSIRYNITKSKHKNAVSKAKNARDEMLKNDKGPKSMSNGYKDFVKKQEELNR